MLSSPLATEEPPYRIHTNRELGMMLRGEKPLAVFSDRLGQFPPVVRRYLRLFDNYVAAGRLIRQVEIEPPEGFRSYPLEVIYFALPAEAWRIDSMKELRRSDHWSLGHERREGELLGYADWQIEWHLDNLKRQGGGQSA